MILQVNEWHNLVELFPDQSPDRFKEKLQCRLVLCRDSENRDRTQRSGAEDIAMQTRHWHV